MTDPNIGITFRERMSGPFALATTKNPATSRPTRASGAAGGTKCPNSLRARGVGDGPRPTVERG